MSNTLLDQLQNVSFDDGQNAFEDGSGDDNEQPKAEETPKAEEPEVEIPEAAEDEPEKEETPEEEPQETEPVGLIGELKQALGLELEGNFAEDHEGLVSFVKQAAETFARSQMDDVFTQFPDVGEYLAYRSQGGKPEDFFQKAGDYYDVAALEFKEDDTVQHEDIVRAYLESRGHDDSEVRDQMKLLRDSERLKSKAQEYLPKLKTQAEHQKQELVQSQKQKSEEYQRNVQEHWNTVWKTIDTNAFEHVRVPETEKKAFFQWLAIPDQNGHTASQREKNDVKTLLELEYIRYKGLQALGLAKKGNKPALDSYRKKAAPSAGPPKGNTAPREQPAFGGGLEGLNGIESFL